MEEMIGEKGDYLMTRKEEDAVNLRRLEEIKSPPILSADERNNHKGQRSQ